MNTASTNSGSLYKAIAFVNLGVLLFAIMLVMIKFAAQHFDAFQISAVRNAVGALLVSFLLARQLRFNVRVDDLSMRQWPLGIQRGLSLAIAQLAFFYAITKIEIATAQTIGYASPLFVTMFSVVLLGDRVGVWRWSAVVIGFIGVFLVLRPFTQEFHWVLTLPLAGALGYGWNLATVRAFDKSVKTLLINSYSSWTAVVVSLFFVVIFSNADWSVPLYAWWFLLGVGICGGLGVYMISAGYREVQPSKVAPFDYFGLLYAILFGWLIFQEAPIDRLFPGVFLIAGAGFLILWRERVSGQKP